MTSDAMLGWLIIGGLVLLSLLFKRRKPPSIPRPTIYEGTGRFELFEIVRPVMFTAKPPPQPKLGIVGWIFVIAGTVIFVAILSH